MTNAYRKDFPLLMAQDIAYLDNAATAQRPQCVLDAVNRTFLHLMDRRVRTPTPCGACTP